MEYVELIRILPNEQALGDINHCWLTPTGELYYSICPYMYDASVFLEKFDLKDQFEEYWWSTRKWGCSAYEYLVELGYAYYSKDACTYPYKQGWSYNQESLTSAQKDRICQLTGDVIE